MAKCLPNRTSLALVTAAAIGLTAVPASATLYQQTNLVSNGFVAAATVDPQLQAPWGVASSATGPFWVSDNNSNLSTLYNTAGVKQSLVVSVDSPTGQVFNSNSAAFQIGGGAAARFIFAGSDGTISAWNAGTAATIVYRGPTGASYNGLTEGTFGTATYLYAANSGSNPGVTVFNSAFTPVTLAGAFIVPNLPAGLVPFNTQILNGSLYVAYANPATPGTGGLVAQFDLNGNFIRVVANGGTLNQPWALDIAPSNFGQFSNDLLVGNLADGLISAFDPTTGAFLGLLDGPNGQPLANVGLWALVNGNGGSGGLTNAVYFDAEGPSGVDGVFGSITVPEPGSLALLCAGLVGTALRRRRAD